MKKHEPKRDVTEQGFNIIRCSCGWESPAIDSSAAFILGRKDKTPDDYFSAHVAAESSTVENQMATPAAEHAIAPAQASKFKKGKR